MQLTNENKENLTKKDKKISVNYAFPEYKTYKKENGDEVELTIYEEPRWSFKDKNELFEIIKESDEDFYNEIKSIIEEYPNRKFDFDLGKSFNYSDELIYFRDFSKETLNEKLNNEFIVRYWTTDDTFENGLPQISNFDSAGESSTIINLNEELSEKLNSMVRDHIKNNIERFEQYKTYRNEQISKVLYEEIKQYGEPSISIDEKGKSIARFQTFTTSAQLDDLLNLPRISWHDAQTGKTYPYQYVLYADFELDENSIDETKEPQIKYFEYVDNGEKEIYTVDSEKKDLSVLVNTDSMKIVTQVFKEIANDYYNQGKQYLQEQTNSQIETKYTKADINDLESFFFSYPQFSESLCYHILDDFELYQIPLFKDSDGNIYQREMNTDLAKGDERDYQLLTQDGIIDQEYNWLIDRKYTPEDEIDFQKEIEDFKKELEDIKKFEENPKSYYKNIFKIALEKEIENVKKEINEGNVKDVIEKNILEIAEEKVGSHAVPEEIIGWYISDDEKNYFENWKNSGDFPYYKEALDAMFAYVYEHDTTKQNLLYISELNETTQNKLKTLLQEHFEKEGLSKEEINAAIQNAIDSKIDDLNQLMESNEKIKSLLTNAKEWQNSIAEWNERRQGSNSEFKPIGTLVEVNPSDEQQCESLRKNTSFIDIYDAELILGMINYDKDSFEFMLDIDNGNFVEIDRKNNKIIDVTDTEGALNYLRDEINYRTQDVVEESFTVEEIAAANRLISPLEFIDNKNRQKILEKNIYVVEEGVVTGSREPSFVPYNEFASKRLLDKTFTTKEACEIFCRKENAFQIAKAHIDEVDNSKEYSEAEKEKYVKVYFEQLEKNWDEYDNQAPSYRELAILIKGLDAFNHGEESLTFTRPDADDIENGFDNGWDFSEICKGYAEFADGYNESNVICRLDDMMIFDSDSDAALQAKKDGYKFLEVGKDIIFPKEILNDDIEYRNYIDTPENRKILNEYLREDLKMGKKENFELKVGDRILISDDDLYAEYGRVHSEELGYYELSCFEIEKISKQKDKVMLKRFSGGHIPQEAFEIEKLIKNKEELDEYLSTISTGKGFLLENNGDIRANNQIRIIPITTVKEHEFNDSYIVSGTGDGTFGEFEITNLENQTLRKNPMLCNFDYRKDVKSASDFLANFTNIRDNLIIEQAPDVYLKEYESNDLTVNNETLTFGQFNSETNELKLIKEAYFKELVIDENDASKNKVVLGFKENGQEQLLEMGEVEYKNLLNAFGFSKEQQDKSLEINKYKTFAEKEPEVVFDMIKSDYLGGTPFSDNELIGYLKGLKKSNNYHHYLDKLLFESLEQSDETLFSKVVDAGADITWRREENGEPINVLHYAAADNLDIAIKKIIEKTKSLEVNDYINLFSEEDFEGLTPLEIAISYSGGKYFGCTKLLIDAMDDEGFSGVEDLLFEDKLGNKVLYTSKDNLDCVSILCFDGNNNIISADTESLVDEKSLGEIVSEDLIYQTNNDFLKGNIELNRSSKLISELKEIPQKLWDDEINNRILLTIPNTFDPQQSFYDFDSILALEKIKKSLFVEFDNQKESLLQGFYTKVEFMDSFSEKELSFEDFQTCGLINFFKDDYWSPVHKSLKFEIADLCFDKKVHELFNSISPRPTDMGMCKNNDYTWLSLNMNDACNNRPITEGEAEIILKYIQYEDYNFYRTVDEKLCMLDVSEDFTGEGEIMTPEKIVDMAHRMMVKARDLEYGIYDENDEKVINDLQERFALIEEQKIESSKDEEQKKQKTSVVEQFFSKLKDSLYDNAKLEDVLKSAATVLQTFSDTEKKEISQYLHNKGASSGDRVGKVLSSILEINEQKQTKKRSKTDDDTRGM